MAGDYIDRISKQKGLGIFFILTQCFQQDKIITPVHIPNSLTLIFLTDRKVKKGENNKSWRREQDSNPRTFRSTVFKTAAFDLSAIPPLTIQICIHSPTVVDFVIGS